MIDTQRSPFEPKGDKPEWKMVYDALLAEADFGLLITYAALEEALGRPFPKNRGPLYRAREELGDLRRRWLEAVPGKGYRVIEAVEHMTVAQKHKRKARRQLGHMIRVGDVTDLSRLDPEQLAQHDSQSRINALLFNVLVRHEQRLQRIEGVLAKEGLL